jgi:hypothetical protein
VAVLLAGCAGPTGERVAVGLAVVVTVPMVLAVPFRFCGWHRYMEGVRP